MTLSPAISAKGDDIDFNRDIRPILSGSCFACHGPDENTREADLRLDTAKGATEDLGDYAAVVPGSADESTIIHRILSDDEDMRMPPTGKGRKLNEEEVRLLRQWIDSGAKYAQHWSYVKPEQSGPPVHPFPHSRVNEIDDFILARLQREGLQPSPPAERATIARRVAITLNGVPPTWEEVRAFVNDTRPEAYEIFVDAQLAKSSFGERWARVWLDLARYADSAGYADDPSRTIWAYRDYVIKSLNQNKPFDQFTIEQLAGDLLENPSDEQLIATALHRNTMTNNEGGTNDEQFRNEAIVDRVNTTMAVWMGTTMACAQCHTHKYDPISQAEYFRFFDFFNQSQDADRRDESPLLQILTDEQKEQRRQLEQQLASLRKVLDTQTPAIDEAMGQWIEQLQEEPQWQPLPIESATSDAGTLELQAEGTRVELKGDRPNTATYTVRMPFHNPQDVAAIQLRVHPEQQSNFVLSRVRAAWVPAIAESPSARFVRIELPGAGRFLHVAEVEVFHEGTNVALQGKASQSSTAFGGPAERAIDGNTDGNFQANSVTHTGQETNPWLEIDLHQWQPIDRVVVWNRTDDGGAIKERIAGYRVVLLDDQRNEVWSSNSEGIPDPSHSYELTGTRRLQFASASADYSQDQFSGDSVLPSSGASTDQAPNPEKGWAIAGGTGASHALTLILATPQKFGEGELVLHLEQVSRFGQHLLTNFGFAITADAQVSHWSSMPESVRALVKKGELSDPERVQLASYYRTLAPLLAETRAELSKLQTAYDNIKPATSVPIMRDVADSQRRTTKIQLRGNYLSLGDEVTAGVPAVFHSLPADMPANRLALAQWLVSAENPLTARVIVNRHWEQVFGIGIVETSEEFGSQGELPTHPALLDWLAVDLIDHGWDIKRLLKQIVMSATYRQSSAISPDLLEADPDNRLCARGPRFRISAEMVRDQALAVTDLLSDKAYGPPVRPPQPSLGLSAAFGSATDWSTSEGEDRYRRAIYTTWRRSNPYPSMATFDAPNREVCTVRRSRTNTPLQALVTLNDPVYVEAAQSLSRQMAQQDSLDKQLQYGFERALLRDPNARELDRLRSMYTDLVAYYGEHSDDARLMASEPLGSLPDGADAAQYAALTVIANTILNLDEFLMPR
ncbi:DUF1553 domain-containing protein [Neorhodopirellula pilleata]|uniref:DUF1553 domain-containing protein n=1 Tax=Neorhodopirellula pilleata TaxID=2714738 RepID=UPI001E438E17|nr:DUF1553 domain-containing protein [Neorhodopirellula pilleata]